MRTRVCLAAALSVALSSLAFATEDSAPPVPERPPLADVIVLCKQQFAENPNGFPEFCAAKDAK